MAVTLISDSSAAVNDQLVPIYSAASMNPSVIIPNTITQGAGPATIPTLTSMNGGAPAAPSTTSPSVGETMVFGVPLTPLLVLVLGAIAYLLLWHIHFRESIAD